MATTKKTAKKEEKRFVSRKEADNIVSKYYALKKYIYDLSERKTINAASKSYLKKALKGLEKWRFDSLNLPRMTNFQHD